MSSIIIRIRRFLLMDGPRRGWWDSILLATCWRYICHSLMILISIVGERIPAPTLNDRVLQLVPLIPLVAKYNYHIWIILYLPLPFWFWRLDRKRCVEFLYAGGVMSLLRGICIFVTNLGPVNGRDVNAGKPMSELLAAWVDIVNPLSALSSDVVHLYLTKDLFFSGHTASTFLILLYTWRYKIIGKVALVSHLLVVAVVFFSHLHYTIDVIGAWAITYCLYVAAQRFFRDR